MIVHVEAVAGILPEDLRRGRGVSAWDPAATVQVVDPECDGEPDDVLQNDVGALPIFSTRLREALDDLGIGVDDIQYLPVDVRHHNDALERGYAIANILTTLEMDSQHSMLTVFPEDFPVPIKRGQLREIRRAAFTAKQMEGHDIIRLAQMPLYLYVSERFKNAFERHRFSGYSFSGGVVEVIP
jgi:hypothetical protein